MKLASSVIALAVVAALTAACDRPKTQGTAYNNSGNSAAPTSSGSSSTNATPNSTATTSDSSTGSAAGSSTASSATSGDATGAMGETMTTGKIKAAIASDPGLKDADISVSTNAAGATLSGTVKSQDQTSLAQTVAQKTEGVQKVEPNPRVK